MRILIVSASAGAGHVRAAEALEEAARDLHAEAEVHNVDVLAFSDTAYRRTYGAGYLKLVNRVPALWGALYKASDVVRRRRVQDRFVRASDSCSLRAGTSPGLPDTRDQAPSPATRRIALRVWSDRRK